MYAKNFRREVNTQVKERKISMENKKTTELMSRKSTLKSKLMAAVSMLLVSAIMVSVTTYAWFILSTAPEVKGMSTTVGSNGALEMALVDYETSADKDLKAVLNSIPTAVGSSSAKASLKEANKTWGNLVDLSDNYYGLTSDDMTLYPAALNMDTSNGKKIGDMNAMLKYAAYGTDGRVAELKGDTFAAKYASGTTGTFQGYDGYGVRAIGTGDKADPIAAGLAAAKRNYNNAVAAVKSIAENSLNNHGQKMAAMAVKSKASDNATYTNDDIQIIKDAKAALVSSAEQIKLAIQHAYNAYMLSTAGTAAELEDLGVIRANLTGKTGMESVLALIGKYETLVGTLNNIAVPQTNETGSYTWSDIETSINALMDSATLKINSTVLANSKIKEAAKAYLDGTATPEQKELIDGLMEKPKITVAKGVYCDIANFVGEYVSVEFDLAILGNIGARDATITIAVSDTTTGATPYFTAANTEVTNLTAPGGGDKQEKDVLTTAYGYVVDLAFRTNASNAKLMLAKPNTERVKDASDLQGGGATFTVPDGTTAANVSKLADALRVVFIDTADKTILGVAAMNKTPTETGGNTYALHMYSYTIEADGTVKLGEQKTTAGEDGQPKADDFIADLTGDTPKAISALVYIDGGAVAYAMDKVTGSLNLQFCTDAELHPMVYKNYATTPLTIDANAVKTVAAGGEAALPKVSMNGSEVTNVTWASSDIETATIVDNNKVKGVKPGDVTITATYRDNSGVHTGSYTLKVS
mgnify:CR=1 FL=1